MKPIYLISLVLLPLVNLAQTSKSVNVYFDVDKADLRTESIAALDQLIEEIKYYNVQSIRLAAHTDHDASVAYNTDLSKRRANSVNNYLTQHGIQAQDVQSSWHSELQPAASNATLDGKQLNRRVEITVVYKPFSSVEEVLNLMKDPVQTFKLRANEPTNIKGTEGLELFIPENAFMDKNGNPIPNEYVTVELEEFIAPGESYVNQLTTESDGKLLESGGMLRVDSRYNGEKVELQPGKEIGIKIPNEQVQEGMTVFNGERRSSGFMNWQNSSRSFNQTVMEGRGSSLTIDTTMFYEFLNWNLEYDRNFLIKIELNLPHKPLAPRKPRAPKEPVRPDPETVLYGFSNWISSTARKNRIADQMYDERMAQYEKQMEVYQRRLDQYEKAMIRYEGRLESYNKESVEIKTSLSNHIEFLKDKFEMLRGIYDQNRLNIAILQLSAAVRLANLKTFSPAGFMSRVGNQIVNDEFYSKLTEISTFISYYEFLNQFEAEEIIENFQYKGEIWVYKMKQMGYGKEFLRNATVNLNLNQKLKEILGEEYIQIEFDKAVQKKMEEDKRLGYYDPALQNFYQTSVPNLGFINCDKFSVLSKNRMISISLGTVIAAKMMVYVKKLKSLMSGDAGMVNVPKGTKVKAIFLAVIDGKPHISIQEAEPKDDISITAQYKMVTAEEAKEMLKNL
jgi:hypothetical protein